ncbi:Heterokaryon incompatibility [Cordyceps militaris CM01]|uniref:Heterokaryon incompatibility n=1 Tax=Cordyceps militaris (strain CM01) TaxID=983644 RepID=G3JGJ3_CORMM|nr:Heterokaryon incompatibility [Cordyceps militaris CM01]EGX92410.1 Heterokaryon incompatibility [Cordyceps militaris CM01]
MTPTFRLLHIATSTLQSFPIGQSPPYLALSHAWSDRNFPARLPLGPSFGCLAIQQTLRQRTALAHIRHCWIDLFCILQDSDEDVCAQIPLMGRIYSDAAAVLVLLTSTLGISQTHVDRGVAHLAPALAVWRAETWTDDAVRRHWTRGDGRAALQHAMDVLARFADATWGTRVWTLQEYLLAGDLVWIGADLTPISIPDELFVAIPRLCEELDIAECARRGDPATSRYELLFSHFAGMAARRIHATDRTRVMEMLGNRAASFPVDEVYGAMAVSTVEIGVRPRETRESAWKRWTEAALAAGHVRWLLLPLAMRTAAGVTACAEVLCAKRHLLSSASGLDTVSPYGPVTVSDGTVSMTARPIGSCTVLRPLGPVHRSHHGWVHRDLTLILYAQGRWFAAVDVAVAFGAGRYSPKQLLMIAQILVHNYDRALRCIQHRAEATFQLTLPSARYERVWADWMQLQAQCVMDALNFGCAHLLRVRPAAAQASFLTVLVTDGRAPDGTLVAFECNARGADGRHKLLIGETPAKEPSGAQALWHKAGVTISVGEDHAEGWDAIPLVEIRIGGARCQVCKRAAAPNTEAQMPSQTRSPTGDDAGRRRWRKRRREEARRRNIKVIRSRLKQRAPARRRYILLKELEVTVGEVL